MEHTHIYRYTFRHFHWFALSTQPSYFQIGIYYLVSTIQQVHWIFIAPLHSWNGVAQIINTAIAVRTTYVFFLRVNIIRSKQPSLHGYHGSWQWTGMITEKSYHVEMGNGKMKVLKSHGKYTEIMTGHLETNWWHHFIKSLVEHHNRQSMKKENIYTYARNNWTLIFKYCKTIIFIIRE